MPLTPLDWVALAVFLAAAFGWSAVVDHIPAIRRRSVIALMDAARRRWMQALLARDNRIMDAQILGNLMVSTSFLANTSLFILGGLVALLASPEMGSAAVASLPYAQAPGAEGWALRIGLLLLIFVRAFFELTWALRQFNYCLIVVGGLPMDPAARGAKAAADAAAAIANRAARHFNSGLRAYYFGLAALAWLLHPVALIGTSLFVLQELYRREFRSVLREALLAEG